MLDRLSSLIPRRVAAPGEAANAADRQDDLAPADGIAADDMPPPEDELPQETPPQEQFVDEPPAHLRPQFSLTAQEGFLTVEGLEKSFGARKVVEHVSIELSRGEAVGLLGPNGAGKTTVFYMITGLITADRGRIELDGHDVTALPMYQRARLGIGYLPQEASIFRGLNVEDNIRGVLELVEPNRRRRSGSTTSSTARMLSSTLSPRKIEASCGR